MKFSRLDHNEFKDATIFLDVDGTLLSDGEKLFVPEMAEKVQDLAKMNDVYLCSNGGEKRTQNLAELLGVKSLPKMRKPFSHKVLKSLQKRERTVVIGDKLITDGFFALRIGAEFIRVDRVVGGERIHIRAVNRADDLLWHFQPFAKIIRPTQWVKNFLVFAPLFFARELFVVSQLHSAVLTFVAFSTAASSVYVFNDMCDIERDRVHPKKKNRPLASGAMSRTSASVLLAGLLVITLGIVSLIPAAGLVIVLYLILNTVYSLSLKHIAVVDILLVATFYVMRIIAGGDATQTNLSPWIILCVFFGALFVILGKRRAEFGREVRRKVLDTYSKEALDFMLVGSAVLTLSSYTLYTVIGHPLPYLLYTTVFVVLAIFRTLNHMYTNPEKAESPEHMLFTDPWIFGTFILWSVSAFIIFYIG